MKEKFWRDYQYIVNYEKVKLLNIEMLNYIEANKKLLGFDKNFSNTVYDIVRIIQIGGIRFRSAATDIQEYVLETTIVNKALDLFEQAGKGLLIASGYSWDDCKKLGHNALDIYKRMNSDDKKSLIDIINKNYGIKNEEDFINKISDFTYIKDANGNPTRLLANISTRYPGETHSKYKRENIKFITQISSELFKIYESKMPKEYESLYDFSRKNDEKLGEIFPEKIVLVSNTTLGKIKTKEEERGRSK